MPCEYPVPLLLGPTRFGLDSLVRTFAITAKAIAAAPPSSLGMFSDAHRFIHEAGSIDLRDGLTSAQLSAERYLLADIQTVSTLQYGIIPLVLVAKVRGARARSLAAAPSHIFTDGGFQYVDLGALASR